MYLFCRHTTIANARKSSYPLRRMVTLENTTSWADLGEKSACPSQTRAAVSQSA